METAIVALISTALIILSSVVMMTSTLQSTSKMAASLQAMNSEFDLISATSISASSADYYGGAISLSVYNGGQSNLWNFSQWDIIAQYDDGEATYLAYTTGTVAGDNQWAVTGIDIAGGLPEIFDPGILNPGEYLQLQVELVPELEVGQSARLTIATPDGVRAQCLVTRSSLP